MPNDNMMNNECSMMNDEGQMVNTNVRNGLQSPCRYSSFFIHHLSFFPRPQARAGFTLLEMVVALGVFSAVMLIAFGVAIAINNAQFKASRIQIVQDDLRFALESMTKEMRTGMDFRPGDFAGGRARKMTFRRSDGVDVTYCRRNAIDAIRKITGGGTNCADSNAQAVTGDDVTVEALTFLLVGEQAGANDGQPRITISLKARSADAKLVSTFNIQTTITQRLRDY